MLLFVRVAAGRVEGGVVLINVLQAGRFLAAMAVVLHHGVVSVAAFVDLPPDWVQATLNLGYLGVDFFFVLSGFIIHYAMERMPRPALAFAEERAKRIFLAYLPVALGLAVAYSLLPGLSEGARVWGWIPTVTLFPTALPPALSVAWTLQHELFFYLIYGLSRLMPGRLWAGMALWLAAIVAAGLAGMPDLALARVALHPINVEFLAGLLAAEAFLRGWRWRAGMAFGAAFALVAAFVLLGGLREQSWLVGLAIACVIPVLCRWEAAGAFSVPGWMVFGGAASYAIYLTHNPLLSILSRGMGALGAGWIVAILGATLICFLAGAAYHLLWERPVLRAMRRRP